VRRHVEITQQAQRSSHARLTGAVYLIYFVTAMLGLFLTARKIPAGALAGWLAPLLYAAVTILLYRLFRRASPRLALAAALCGLAGCVNDELHQRHLGLGGEKSLLFFGPFCVLLGVLILRSQIVPRWLGWPLVVAGAGWLAYLIPWVAQHAKIEIFPVGFLAEFALMLWLLLRGVNEARWRVQQSRA
jgi:Domain of unknown function (DUF4386)